jgi:LPS export ABC transporter protein LptC
MIKLPDFFTVFHKPRIIVPGLLFMSLISSCSNSMKEIDELTKGAKMGQDRGRDVTIMYSKGGKLTARVFAHTFIRSESALRPYTEMKDSLRVDFYDDSMRVINTVTAGYARGYEKESNLLLRDHIHIVNNRNEHLYTEELVWNQKMQKFFTDKPVRIVTPTQVMKGTGMEATQDFSWYKIRDLTGEVELPKEQLPGE